MRKKVRNLFLFFTVLAVLLPGCGGQADAGDTGADEEKNDTQTVQEDTDEYSCGFIVGSFEQVFYQKLGDAIESEAAQIGMHAIVTDSELDSQVASNKFRVLRIRAVRPLPFPAMIRREFGRPLTRLPRREWQCSPLTVRQTRIRFSVLWEQTTIRAANWAARRS